MFNYTKIRGSGFEPGHTSLWKIYFTPKNGGDKLNLLGTNHAPIQDYTFKYSIKTANIKTHPLDEDKITLTKINTPVSIDLTFFETHKYTIMNFLLNHAENILKNGALSLNKVKEKSLELVLNEYDKQGNLYKTHFINILPIEDLIKRGDQDMSLLNLPLKFTITDYSSKRNEK